MRYLRARAGLALSAVLALVSSLVGVSPASASLPCAIGSAPTVTTHTVVSSDGTKIAITSYKPATAFAPGDPCGSPVPVILTLHGWGGSRAKTATNPEIAGILSHGYGAVSIDSRGHGDSGGQALVHHPSREVNDFRAVMDFIYDNLDWVQKDFSFYRKDIRVGASGGSYGGGFQLMTAAFDQRLDAIFPQITWNSLPQSLAPNGALKSDWLSLLYAAGKLSVDLDPRIDQWLQEAQATNRPPAGFLQSFSESSPFYWMQNIRVPTLLAQGIPDTLFPLNEAVHNYVGLRNNGNPTWLVGYNTGHILPGVQPTGLGGPARTGTGDCGNLSELAFTFFDAYLRNSLTARAAMSATPKVQLATEQRTCVRSADWPVNSSVKSTTFPAVAVPQAGGSLLLPLFTADATTTVAGIPELSAKAPIELDDVFYASLVVKDAAGLHVVDDQVMGARTQLASVEGTFFMELGGVATTLQPGDTLYLRLDGANEQYVLNANRRPGAAVFTDLTLATPIAG